MASINICEDDFNALASAAFAAIDAGDIHAAQKLDVLARKANAALSNASMSGLLQLSGCKKLKWTDVPSVLEPTTLDKGIV